MPDSEAAGSVVEPHPYRRHLPRPEQQLMLAAAIGSGEEAVEAWLRWRETIDLDDVTGAETRAIPLAFRNPSLHDEIAADPDAGRLRGIYRRSWVRNQLQMQAGASVIRRMREQGIEMLALKGAAMNCLYYPDRGVRTMNDIDLLVRPEQAEAALEALAGCGYRRPGMDPRRAIGRRHGLDFKSEEGLDLDLHWYSLMLSADDSDFWEASVGIAIAGEPARALCPTDQLLHILVHGACDSHSFIWAADAVEVLTTAASEIDWERFVVSAELRSLTVICVAMLDWLDRGGWVEVSAEPLERLRAVKAPEWERRGFRALTAPSSLARTIRLANERRRRMRASLPREHVPGPYAAVDGLYDYRPPGRLLIDGFRGVGRRLRDRIA